LGIICVAMTPVDEPLDVLIMIGMAMILLLLACCCMLRLVIVKCIAAHKQRKVAIAQHEPLIIDQNQLNQSNTDTMQRLLQTQNMRHLEARFAAEGKDIRPEPELSSNVSIDHKGWMKMAVHQGMSSSLRPYYFKFSHQRERMWYHDKETAVNCSGTVEIEYVQSVELVDGDHGFGFEIIADRKLVLWCDTERDRDEWVSVLQRCMMERIGLIESAEGQSNDEMVYSEYTITVNVVQDALPIPFTDSLGI